MGAQAKGHPWKCQFSGFPGLTASALQVLNQLVFLIFVCLALIDFNLLKFPDRVGVFSQEPLVRALRNSSAAARTSDPTATKLVDAGSGTIVRVGENTGLATPGSFCSKV